MLPLAEIASSFHTRGFAVIPSFFSQEEMEPWKAKVEAIQREVNRLPEALAAKLVMERNLSPKQSCGLSPQEKGDAIFIIGDAPAFDPRLALWMLEPRLLAVMRLLLGSEEILYHFSNVTMKQRQVGSAITWHRDYPNGYLCPKGSTFLRVMLCLDGMTQENGATGFIEGSHQLTDEEAAAAKAAKAAKVKVEGEPEVTVALCPPGSLVLIHPKVLHGGPPNRSSVDRRNLIVQWGRVDDPIGAIPPEEERLASMSPEAIRAWVMG